MFVSVVCLFVIVFAIPLVFVVLLVVSGVVWCLLCVYMSCVLLSLVNVCVVLCLFVFSCVTC